MKSEGIDDVSRFYPKFEPAFEAFGAIRKGKIGNADAQLCNTTKMKEALRMIIARKGDTELLADDRPLNEALFRIE